VFNRKQTLTPTHYQIIKIGRQNVKDVDLKQTLSDVKRKSKHFLTQLVGIVFEGMPLMKFDHKEEGSGAAFGWQDVTRTLLSKYSTHNVMCDPSETSPEFYIS